MTQTPPTLTADPPGVMCFHCEYDLRGLPREGRCPECGSAIDLSWRREEERRARGIVPLGLAARGWLMRMMIGCLLLLASTAGPAAEAWLVLNRNTQRQWVWIAIAFCSPLVILAALWLLGSREPGTRTRTNGPWVRYGIRAVAILNPGVMFVALLLSLRIPPAELFAMWRRIEIMQAVVGAVATALVLLRLAHAARRDARGVLRRWLIILLCIAPWAVLFQTCLDADIPTAPAAGWLLSPHPVLGFPEVVVVVPVALSRGVISGVRLAAWTVQGILSLAMLGLVARSAWMFKCAAARGGRTPTSSRS